MILKECILVKNSCYINGQKMLNECPTGIVVHSTGCNNKTLKRYVQPVSEQEEYNEIINDIGKNCYNNHWNMSSEQMHQKVCVHAFIGTNAWGEVETYQTLPFDICCWGVGSGKKGSYNFNPTARIQFEICEDNLKDETYFNKVMKEAQQFCAYLCKKFKIDVDKICSHHEAYVAGYGSNHGDPENWMSNFGKDMNWFRAEVQKILNEMGQPEIKETKKVFVEVIRDLFIKIKELLFNKNKLEKEESGQNEALTSTYFDPYIVVINTDILNIRSGPGTNYPKVGIVNNKEVYTIVEESCGNGAIKWGKLKSGIGWISLDYCLKK